MKPYRKSNKSDFPEPMAIKAQEKLDWQALQRVRYQLLKRRTPLINNIRRFLPEHDIACAAQPLLPAKEPGGVIEDAVQSL